VTLDTVRVVVTHEYSSVSVERVQRQPDRKTRLWHEWYERYQETQVVRGVQLGRAPQTNAQSALRANGEQANNILRRFFYELDSL
jgi:hypothetical protein